MGLTLESSKLRAEDFPAPSALWEDVVRSTRKIYLERGAIRKTRGRRIMILAPEYFGLPFKTRLMLQLELPQSETGASGLLHRHGLGLLHSDHCEPLIVGLAGVRILKIYGYKVTSFRTGYTQFSTLVQVSHRLGRNRSALWGPLRWILLKLCTVAAPDDAQIHFVSLESCRWGHLSTSYTTEVSPPPPRTWVSKYCITGARLR